MDRRTLSEAIIQELGIVFTDAVTIVMMFPCVTVAARGVGSMPIVAATPARG